MHLHLPPRLSGVPALASSNRRDSRGSGCAGGAMSADTVGLVIARTPIYDRVLSGIVATEWRTHIRAAIDAGHIFVGAGRPDITDGAGIYIIVGTIGALPEAIAVAHTRIGEYSRLGTAWLVYGDAEVERISREALAQLMPTAGCA